MTPHPSKKSRDFFTLLRTRVGRTPDARFDERFWRGFEAEFGKTKSVDPAVAVWSRFWSALLQFRFVGLVSAAAGVAAVIYLRSGQVLPPTEFLEPVKLVAVQGVLDNLDLLENLDDVDLSEADWRVLLGESDAA